MKIAFLTAPCRKLKAFEGFLKVLLTLSVKMIYFKLKIDALVTLSKIFDILNTSKTTYVYFLKEKNIYVKSIA